MFPALILSLAKLAAIGHISFLAASFTGLILPSLFAAPVADTPLLLILPDLVEPPFFPTRSIPNPPSPTILIKASPPTESTALVLLGVAAVVGIGAVYALFKRHFTTSSPPPNAQALPILVLSTHPATIKPEREGNWAATKMLGFCALLCIHLAAPSLFAKFSVIDVELWIRLFLSPQYFIHTVVAVAAILSVFLLLILLGNLPDWDHQSTPVEPRLVSQTTESIPSTPAEPFDLNPELKVTRTQWIGMCAFVLAQLASFGRWRYISRFFTPEGVDIRIFYTPEFWVVMFLTATLSLLSGILFSAWFHEYLSSSPGGPTIPGCPRGAHAGIGAVYTLFKRHFTTSSPPPNLQAWPILVLSRHPASAYQEREDNWTGIKMLGFCALLCIHLAAPSPFAKFFFIDVELWIRLFLSPQYFIHTVVTVVAILSVFLLIILLADLPDWDHQSTPVEPRLVSQTAESIPSTPAEPFDLNSKLKVTRAQWIGMCAFGLAQLASFGRWRYISKFFAPEGVDIRIFYTPEIWVIMFLIATLSLLSGILCSAWFDGYLSSSPGGSAVPGCPQGAHADVLIPPSVSCPPRAGAQSVDPLPKIVEQPSICGHHPRPLSWGCLLLPFQHTSQECHRRARVLDRWDSLCMELTSFQLTLEDRESLARITNLLDESIQRSQFSDVELAMLALENDLRRIINRARLRREIALVRWERREEQLAEFRRLLAEMDDPEPPPAPIVKSKPVFEPARGTFFTCIQPLAHFDADGRSTGFRRD